MSKSIKFKDKQGYVYPEVYYRIGNIVPGTNYDASIINNISKTWEQYGKVVIFSLNCIFVGTPSSDTATLIKGLPKPTKYYYFLVGHRNENPLRLILNLEGNIVLDSNSPSKSLYYNGEIVYMTNEN